MQASRLSSSMLLVRETSRIQKRRITTTIARYDTKRRDNVTRCNPFVTLYIATSQDGFIADEHGSVDWLPEPESNADSTCATDYGYAKFFESIDTVVMGSKSYEQVLTFGVEWPYSGKQCFVFTPVNHWNTLAEMTTIMVKYPLPRLTSHHSCIVWEMRDLRVKFGS
ncbi:hypothetical protein D3C80_1659500 [compost metagenome]